jgi:spore coat protein H
MRNTFIILSTLLLAVCVLTACGGDSGGLGNDSDARADGGPPLGDGSVPGPVSDQELEQAVGCPGVYNPDQVLSYHVDLAPGDWSGLLADTSYSMVYPAQFRCGDGVAITVGVRRKRSGGAMKVGFKVDMNAFVPGQSYQGLRKFSLENGVSEGQDVDGAAVREYVSEYLSWRLMRLSGTLTGRAALARIYVNGDYLGVYVNVEQVDKRFLRARLGEDTGWLYKKSGGVRDGFKTHEIDGLADPYEAYFCFWKSGNSCPIPSAEELAQTLPERLDIEQLLRYGAVNAIIANADSLLFKDNNYYWYDRQVGGRVYIPWDLDTVMKANLDVFTGGGGGGTDVYLQALFPTWEADYEAILTELLNNQLTLDVILGELDRVSDIATDAFDSDPYVVGSTADATSSLRAYWSQRHPEVVQQVAAH